MGKTCEFKCDIDKVEEIRSEFFPNIVVRQLTKTDRITTPESLAAYVIRRRVEIAEAKKKAEEKQI